MVGKMVLKTGATFQARGLIYEAEVQSVLLYISEIWVVMGEMLKALEGFHHRIARRITGMTAQSITGRGWEWPPVAEALETAVI